MAVSSKEKAFDFNKMLIVIYLSAQLYLLFISISFILWSIYLFISVLVIILSHWFAYHCDTLL